MKLKSKIKFVLICGVAMQCIIMRYISLEYVLDSRDVVLFSIILIWSLQLVFNLLILFSLLLVRWSS